MNFLKKNHENRIINKYDLSKTIKILQVVIISILTFSCSSDDDSSSGGGDTATTAELLTSSTWYQESRTPGNFTDCEKNTSVKFNTNNTVIVETFSEDTGTCESQGADSAAYVLNGMSLTITIGTEVITATINSISQSSLNITDNQGDTIVFDKTQG